MTDKLLKSLREEIPTLERQISLPAIVRSAEPSVMKLRNENYGQVLSFAVMCVKNYLEYCFPNNVNIAAQFAADLIDSRPTWKMADFVMCFKWLRQNPQPVFGNQITPQRLLEIIVAYEEQRANAMEQAHYERKGQQATENKVLNPLAEKLALKMRANGHVPTGDIKLGKEMDAQRTKSEREGYGNNVIPKQNHKDFFEQ